MDLRQLSPNLRLWFPFMAHDGQRRRRLWKRLAIVTGSVLVASVVVACSASPGSSSHPSASKPSLSPPSVGASSSSGGLSATTLGPSACVIATQATAGSGSWKLVTPATLCGLPEQTSAQYQQSGQSLATLDKDLIGMDDAGSVTSTITAAYQSPQTPNFYRAVTFVGFDGTFQPAAALSAMEQPGETYTSEPPGPHGGRLVCSSENDGGDCVWATSTTVAEITISDSTRELLGANIGANAVRIRDALEASA